MTCTRALSSADDTSSKSRHRVLIQTHTQRGLEIFPTLPANLVQLEESKGYCRDDEDRHDAGENDEISAVCDDAGGISLFAVALFYGIVSNEEVCHQSHNDKFQGPSPQGDPQPGHSDR